MEITKLEIEKMANDYVNNINREHYPGIVKSYLFEGYVEGIMEFCQKMNINVIVKVWDLYNLVLLEKILLI